MSAHCVLTPAQRADFCRRAATGEPNSSLAIAFGLTRAQVKSFKTNHAPEIEQAAARASSRDGLLEMSPTAAAVRVLQGRVTHDRNGRPLLDGQPAEWRAIVRAANAIRRERGQEPIAYPGVEPARRSAL